MTTQQQLNGEVDQPWKIDQKEWKKEARVWALTIFNYSEVAGLITEKPKRKWMVYQEEQCPKTGKKHIQAGIAYTSGTTFERMKKKFGTAHIEQARNPTALWKYCQKEETRVGEPVIFGEEPEGQGARTDLQMVTDMIKEKKTMREIVSEHTESYIKYHRGIEKAWKILNCTERAGKPYVRWIWGESGTGKTRLATEGKDYYMKDETKWWDGYKQGQHIVIDDFDGKWNYKNLLRLLDRYKYQGQEKGDYIPIVDSIDITCSMGPKEILYAEYIKEDDSEYKCNNMCKELTRRLDEVIHLSYLGSDNGEVH